MKIFLNTFEKLSRSEQKQILGGANDANPEPFCIHGMNSWDCTSELPYFSERTGSCCDRRDNP